MPIKNYQSKMPVTQSIARIQQELVDHGATGIMMDYERGTGRISSLRFLIQAPEGKPMGFSLPVDWRAFQAVLKSQNVRRWDDDDYCYRVAWANLRDWVDSQMAMLETRMIDMPQIFLPFAVTKGGKTLYEQVMSNGSLL